VKACGLRASVGSFGICLLLVLLSAGALVGQEYGGSEGSTPEPVQSGLIRPDHEPSRVETGPEVDGEVLDDPAWKGAVPATGFWQTTPFEGQAATEKTEIFIVYTDDTLYFGIVCYDRTPDGIIIADSRRDSSLEETDSFQIVLDTYQDQLTGFVFGTNPAGIEYDGQVTREGEGGPFSAAGLNLNWNGDWHVAAKTSEIGWSAEMAIPFRTLRYPRINPQKLGMNFQRNIRRRNETSYWSQLPRQYDLFRLSMAGTMSGVSVPPQRNLRITPYVLGDWIEDGVEDSEVADDQEIGIDVIKYSITPSLTLDGTINTDFAQVEVDELQINLDRFNLFFPEKRPFFLENAGYFSVGVAESVELFYSRRIGLGPKGEEVPINWGGRLSGKTGKYNLGFLYNRTGGVEDVAPQNDVAVARVSRDLPNRSGIGGIVISREGRGEFALEEDYNRTFGLDGRWGIGQNGLVKGFVSKTQTPGLEGDDHAYSVGGNYDSEAWSFSANFTEVADNFNPEVGFLTRKGYRKPDFFVLRRIRPKDLLGFQELRPHVSYRGYWDFDGFQETGFLHIDNHWEWRSGYEVHTGINFTREGLHEPFEIFDGIFVPAGTYDNTEAQIIFYTNQGAPAAFELRWVQGGFFNGNRLALTPAFRFRIGEAFNTEVSWQYNDIDLDTGEFETNLGRLRVSYSFTPKIFVQALVQYNDVADIWASNLRLGWLHRASTGLYVVYNEIRDLGGAGTGIPDRSLTLKYSRMFDLLR